MARVIEEEGSPLLDRREARPRSPGRRPRVLVLPRLLREAARLFANHESTEENAYRILNRWRELEVQGHLARKETSLRPEFLNEVFGDALGYKPAIRSPDQYQFEHEFAVEQVGSADAALGNFSPHAPRDPQAVVEVKDAATDLDRDRFAGRTPVQQCWDYLNALPNCRFGIVTNFITFRLYYKPKGTLAYQEFKLDELGDRQRFREFFVLFERNGLLP